MKCKLLVLLAAITISLGAGPAALAMYDPGVEGQGGECLAGCDALAICVDIYYPEGDWLGCLGY